MSARSPRRALIRQSSICFLRRDTPPLVCRISPRGIRRGGLCHPARRSRLSHRLPARSISFRSRLPLHLLWQRLLHQQRRLSHYRGPRPEPAPRFAALSSFAIADGAAPAGESCRGHHRSGPRRRRSASLAESVYRQVPHKFPALGCRQAPAEPLRARRCVASFTPQKSIHLRCPDRRSPRRPAPRIPIHSAG